MSSKLYLHDDEYYYTLVRSNIKRIRTAKNLTQQDLADMVGMSREYIADIENENRYKHPTLLVIGRVADALNVKISELFETTE